MGRICVYTFKEDSLESSFPNTRENNEKWGFDKVKAAEEEHEVIISPF